MADRGDDTSRGERVTLIFSGMTDAADGFLRNLFTWRGVVDGVVALDLVSLLSNWIELSSSNGLFVDER